MSNERIDLTKFEGLTTPWDFHAKYLHIERAKVAVKLIAELKRSYEKIDWLQQAADLAADFIGEIHHSHWDNFEERMIEAGLWKRPSE